MHHVTRRISAFVVLDPRRKTSLRSAGRRDPYVAYNSTTSKQLIANWFYDPTRLLGEGKKWNLQITLPVGFTPTGDVPANVLYARPREYVRKGAIACVNGSFTYTRVTGFQNSTLAERYYYYNSTMLEETDPEGHTERLRYGSGSIVEQGKVLKRLEEWPNESVGLRRPVMMGYNWKGHIRSLLCGRGEMQWPVWCKWSGHRHVGCDRGISCRIGGWLVEFQVRYQRMMFRGLAHGV